MATRTSIPEVDAACTDERLAEQALRDLVVSLIDVLRPCDPKKTIRLLAELREAIENGGRR
jgi:hypothetical protein